MKGTKRTRSPLQGLSEAAKRGEVTLVELTPEQRVRVGLVTRIVALCDLLDGSANPALRWGESVRLVTYDREGATRHVPMTVDTHEREPSSWISFTRAGAVTEHRCEYSGHNGDSYGHTERELGHEEALKALQGLNHLLERRALDAEERRLEEAADRRRADAAMKNLNARLRNMGVL